MPEAYKQEIKLFYCYARADKSLRDELEKHLSALKRQYNLNNWHDRVILPGEDFEREIDQHLNDAELILILISPDFMASEYCYGVEMQRALERHQEETCCVVPILLRPMYWEDSPFSSIQVLPTDAKPITRWSDRDDAFHDVVKGLSATIKSLLASRQIKTLQIENNEEPTAPEHSEKETFARPILTNAIYYYERGDSLRNKGDSLRDQKRFEEATTSFKKALIAYEQSISLNPNNMYAHYNKGNTLRALKRYEEALVAYECAIHHNPAYFYAYNSKGIVLNALQRYEEALETYKQAIVLNPNYGYAYNNMGNTLRTLQRYEDALEAYKQAIVLIPNYSGVYNNIGNAYRALKHYGEALWNYEQAIRLEPRFAEAYYNKGLTYKDLGEENAAKWAFRKASELGYRL